jgi:hypothetical protein
MSSATIPRRQTPDSPTCKVGLRVTRQRARTPPPARRSTARNERGARRVRAIARRLGAHSRSVGTKCAALRVSRALKVSRSQIFFVLLVNLCHRIWLRSVAGMARRDARRPWSVEDGVLPGKRFASLRRLVAVRPSLRHARLHRQSEV